MSSAAKWLQQDYFSLIATLACAALTVCTAIHMISEHAAIVEETRRIVSLADETSKKLLVVKEEVESVSSGNIESRRQELDKINGEIIAKKTEEDAARQKSDDIRREMCVASESKQNAADSKETKNQDFNVKSADAKRRAEEKGLLKTSWPFDAGPDPTGGRYVIHWYEFNKWKARKALAEELNAAIGPVKVDLDSMSKRYADMERRFNDLQNNYKQANEALLVVRQGINELDSKSQEIRALIANPILQKQLLDDKARELEKQTGEYRRKAQNAGATKAWSAVFHLPMLLWLSTLSIQNLLRLLVFRQRLSPVRLEHAH